MNEFLKMLSEKKLTLIMSLPRNDPQLCAAAFEAGADPSGTFFPAERAGGEGE